ncbi:TIMELESS-interacting protein [Dioscorea cayenensis subsp. rotundata]|uniref:TIMELESS-interacting protein n=1 Tax=Dioscorea cayennensis subsp. rotundata TaxID=55577 RepID=A0AB40AIT7_DIOCR|nr:TIMELESS-interacting protein [Dioscorea cayenensis subsp. rotundata]
MEKSAAAGATAAPTGCFKCGRPGHWSRDCPSSATKPFSSSSFSSNPPRQPPLAKPSSAAAAAGGTKPTKTAPRTRPKLTPDLLLSENGLGYVLRHFPRSFKYHGRGHEVSDLRNLINLYVEWHSRLIPYYSFDQFVLKLEKVGTTRRVKRCISELRERIARGEDPTKLHEPPVEPVAPDCAEDMEQMDANTDERDPTIEAHDVDDIQEEMFDEIYRKATQDPNQSVNSNEPELPSKNTMHVDLNPVERSTEEIQNQVTNNNAVEADKIQITEEQRVRMEANRLKAIERAAARARLSQAS